MLIDAIMFFNELELLEIRLHELDSIVDKFVIVESQEMHGSANLKRFVLEDNWDIVKPFEKKICYVQLPKLEPEFTGQESCWPRENFNRNAMMIGINSISKSENDIIMISDCDEIPKASAIKTALPRINKMTGTKQDFYYYNVETYGGTWHGTVIGRVSDVRAAGGPQAVRNQRDNYSAIPSCGWHFSYFGGIEKIRTKTKNFAHSNDLICRELNGRSDEEIKADIIAGRDLYHRDGVNFSKQSPGNLPEYLEANRERFKHFYE